MSYSMSPIPDGDQIPRNAAMGQSRIADENSYPAATQQERTDDRDRQRRSPAVASRPRSRKPAMVSASALALHLDCSRTYIGKLEAEGVLQRQGDGFSPAYAALNLRQATGAKADEAAEAHDAHSTARAAADRFRPWK